MFYNKSFIAVQENDCSLFWNSHEALGAKYVKCAESEFLGTNVTTKCRSAKLFSKLLPGCADPLVVGRGFPNCTQYTTGPVKLTLCSD